LEIIKYKSIENNNIQIKNLFYIIINMPEAFADIYVLFKYLDTQLDPELSPNEINFIKDFFENGGKKCIVGGNQTDAAKSLGGKFLAYKPTITIPRREALIQPLIDFFGDVSKATCNKSGAGSGVAPQRAADAEQERARERADAAETRRRLAAEQAERERAEREQAPLAPRLDALNAPAANLAERQRKERLEREERLAEARRREEAERAAAAAQQAAEAEERLAAARQAEAARQKQGQRHAAASTAAAAAARLAKLEGQRLAEKERLAPKAPNSSPKNRIPGGNDANEYEGYRGLNSENFYKSCNSYDIPAYREDLLDVNNAWDYNQKLDSNGLPMGTNTNEGGHKKDKCDNLIKGIREAGLAAPGGGGSKKRKRKRTKVKGSKRTKVKGSKRTKVKGSKKKKKRKRTKKRK
jgi:hypothetical protein